MRSRLVAIILLLIVAMTGLVYFVVGASVRGSSDSTIRKAAAYALKGKPEQAREELKWLLWFEPRHPTAVHLTAISYLKQNNLPAAMERLRLIGEDSALHENAQSLLASALLADQQFEDADDVLRQILTRYPKSAIACRQLSGLWLTELRFREAVQVLEEYLRRTLKEPIILSDLLFLLRDLGSAEFLPPAPQDCVETLRTSLERHPDQFRVQLALANCYVRLSNLDDAEPLLQEARQRHAQEFEYQIIDCEFWLAKGEADRADAALMGPSPASAPGTNKGQTLDSDDRYWELRCRVAELRDDPKRALADIDRALSLRPFTKEYESRRARLLQKLQRAEEARQVYDRSHEFAKSELELWRLTRDLGTRTPTLAECEQVARLYESLGKSLQAGAWRRLSELLPRDAPAK